MTSDIFDLGGRVALVTGAAAGIGKAIALGLARHGADLVVCDVDDAGIARTVAEITSLGRRAVETHADIGKPDDIAALFDALDEAFGQIDILINNVGSGARSAPEALPLAEWNRVLASGVTGSFLCAQAAARRMIARGRGGSIVNISSIAGASALGRGNLVHSVNKGAVNQLTRELAVEWAKHKIRVNAILPCQVITEGFQTWLDSPGFDPDLMARFLDGIPMNRLAAPEDMVGPAVFLASDAAAMVTGTLLAVDGGNLALNAGGSHTWQTAPAATTVADDTADALPAR
jgi:NAD(P)-dependent dehydrogenase (short-subunit alcohol dehydrogenase family)